MPNVDISRMGYICRSKDYERRVLSRSNRYNKYRYHKSFSGYQNSNSHNLNTSRTLHWRHNNDPSNHEYNDFCEQHNQRGIYMIHMIIDKLMLYNFYMESNPR